MAGSNSIGVIIFARMSSSRLPGKSLMNINGRSLLGRVLDRCRKIQDINQILIATSDQPSDDPIELFADEEGVDCFRGDLIDVAGRALACAQKFNMDYFVRVCGDRPFHDPEIATHLIEYVQAEEVDLATNCQIKSFPAGMACEVVKTSSLEHSLAATNVSEDREHVTRWFYSHSEDVNIFNLKSPHPEWATLNFAIDTEMDLNRANEIAKISDAEGLPSIQRMIEIAAQVDGA